MCAEMFGFMKKHSEKDKEEKERKRREKEEKKAGSAKGSGMTAEELGQLEDAKKKMEKKSLGSSGPTRSSVQSSSVRGRVSGEAETTKPSSRSASSASSGHPPVPTKPKKGILKDKSSYGQPVPNHGVRGNVDDTMVLEENTLANENLVGGSSAAGDASKPPAAAASSVVDGNAGKASASPNDPKVPPQRRSKSSGVRRSSSKLSASQHQQMSAASPVVPVARPPSPIDTCYNDVNLQLPEVAAPSCPQSRVLVIRRQAAGDFGFTLRKGVVLERLGAVDSPDERQRTVIFAEPGPKQIGTGLLPGDRLVEVNGVNVENSNREAIIDLIRKSGDTVTVIVQPIPELSELSMRSATHDQENVPSNTAGNSSDHSSGNTKVAGSLHRSGSMKYRTGQVCRFSVV